MKILIQGGGVAGPALAQFLKDDADITIVDKAPQWGNVGYGINLWGNGQKILADLGIDHQVLKQSHEIPWSSFENKKGEILKIVLFDIFHSFGPTVVVTRTALQQTLVKGLENYRNIHIKLGTSITDIKQDGQSATVTLSDGSMDTFDLVVGADGIRSQVREMVFGKNFVKYYGWNIYAFWAPHGNAAPLGGIEFASGGKMCWIFPVEDKSVVMLWVAGKHKLPDDTNYQKALHETFADFRASVDHLIDTIEDPSHIFKDTLAYVDMKQWYKGWVVLMGDAQHATSPIMGMGASMALEDAYVLADELKKSQGENIPLALERYQERRSRRIKQFRKASRFIESFMLVKSPILSVFTDFLLKIIPSSVFARRIEKILAEEI